MTSYNVQVVKISPPLRPERVMKRQQEGRAVAGNYRAMRGTCTESFRLSSGNAVNRNNTKTIGKHEEVVDTPLYKCTSEVLIHLAA